MSVGSVSALWRYPVKSVLGEQVRSASLTSVGIELDRAFAIIDVESGKVASAKRPQLWRKMLDVGRRRGDTIRFPDGETIGVAEAGIDEKLSAFLGRAVRMSTQAAPTDSLDRAIPEEVLERGEGGEAGSTHLVLAQASPDGGFFDYAPYHVILRSSLDHVRDAIGDDSILVERYRANIVIDIPGLEPFAENGWAGIELKIGPNAVLSFIGRRRAARCRCWPMASCRRRRARSPSSSNSTGSSCRSSARPLPASGPSRC
ncbi:MOSC N-terminal beta barrel domain-containing protein [Chenggangzhangella methanolivorans]|uniref:MOSC N-terminal beta barrel domain-containing protein n=1 Tax=Chenggangzhangella methanolivorans TaxID=1437009 RepID=A0A9E6RDD3_9HYPH|nr:MOSC N-terminal beta barrel domain-containing protein [Chenggangzhangella methanolivorans]QZN99000.1 MOSC N-terminal beta barrel domain-containing protein [Chenggangzhangella methanolivorans]